MDKTSTLTNEMMVYYERVFLKRAKYQLVLKEGGQMRTQGQNDGALIKFNRYTPFDPQDTALTEGVNPPVSTITAATVSCILAEYGLTIKMSKFLTLTSIDVNNREKISLLGQNMGETLNRLVRNELENGTVYWAGGKVSSTIASSDTFSPSDMADVVTNLEDAKAMPYEDGFFMGKINTHDKNKLIKSSTWVNAKTYSDVKKLYQGEMGELYQVRCLLNIDKKTSTGTGATSSSVTVYHSYIHGSESFGCYDLEGDMPHLDIIVNKPDSGNPAARFSLASWSGSYVSKILNSAWIYVVKSA